MAPRRPRNVSRVKRPRQETPDDFREESRKRTQAGGGGGGGSSARDRPRTTTRTPIGVPEGFRATAPGYTRGGRYSALGGERAAAQGRQPGTTRAPYPVAPRYYEGDEWKPQGYGTEAIIAKQRALMLAGFLSPDADFSFGSWDDKTRDAYWELLAQANAAGVTADEALLAAAQSIPNPGAGGEGGGLRQGRGGEGGYTFDPVTGELIPEPYVAPPLELKLPNRDELRAAFRRGVITELGQGWDAARIESMVDAYMAEVTRLQTDAYSQAVNYDRAQWEGTLPEGGGGVVTEISAPSAESFLSTEMERRDPEGYRAGKIVNEAIPAFLQAIQGWSR